MKHLHRVTLIVLLVSAVSASWVAPSHACSPGSIPTPAELVARADAIYLAKANDYVVPLSERAPGVAPMVEFSIVATFKGEATSSLRFAAALTGHDDFNDENVPYSFVRPSGRRGNCYAVTYRSGAYYLLFIKSGTPYWAPLAPTNEQVRSRSDPWVAWVKSATSGVATQPN